MTWTIPQRAEAQRDLFGRLVLLANELDRIIEAFPDPSPDGVERLWSEDDLRTFRGTVRAAETTVRGLSGLFAGLQPKAEE